MRNLCAVEAFKTITSESLGRSDTDAALLSMRRTSEVGSLPIAVAAKIILQPMIYQEFWFELRMSALQLT